MISASLKIDSQVFLISQTSSLRFFAREDSVVSLEISTDRVSEKIEAYFEDAEVNLLSPTYSGDIVSIRSSPDNYFSECFGETVLRIYSGGESLIAVVDVQAKKITAEQALKMISFLSERHETLIRTCFTRSTVPIGSNSTGIAQPETYLDCAEKFLNLKKDLILDLVRTRRTRLIPTKEMAWSPQSSSAVIDVVDVIEGLDGIIPTQESPDLIIRKRGFKVMNLPLTVLRESSDLLENQILLGGLYSIRTRVEQISTELLKIRIGEIETARGYESLRSVVLKLTCTGMLSRCERIKSDCIDLTRVMEERLGVKYMGELHPRMTPYARSSKSYRLLFTSLADWYALGELSFGVQHFVVKLRSLWQIYEFFCLFVLSDCLMRSGWRSLDCLPDPDFRFSVPSMISFARESCTLKVYYNKKIKPIQNELNESGLVDVKHRGSGLNSHWRPDFILELNIGESDNRRYIILDSKYSTEKIVKELHLPMITQKYYWGTSFYDSITKRIDNRNISGVAAIYPKAGSPFINGRSGSNDLKSLTSVLPMLFGAHLSIDSPIHFEKLLNHVIDEVFEAIRFESTLSKKASTSESLNKPMSGVISSEKD